VDTFKNGKTAVRGGFGCLTFTNALYDSHFERPGSPFFEIANSSSLDPGSFPDKALPSIPLGQGLEYGYVEPHPHRN